VNATPGYHRRQFSLTVFDLQLFFILPIGMSTKISLLTVDLNLHNILIAARASEVQKRGPGEPNFF